MVRLLFIISVITIPFSDFMAVLPLGEMEHELSSYFFLLTLVASLVFSLNAPDRSGSSRFQMKKIHYLPTIMWLMFGVVFISFVMNFPTMLGESFRGRFAVIKYLTSIMVVFYGFTLAYLTYYMAERFSWHELIVRPLGIAVFICAIVGLVEYLSWTGGAAKSVMDMISFVHIGSNESEHGGGFLGGTFGWGNIEGRIRSVCFEPPALANFAGLAWPWIYGGIISTRGKDKAWYIFLFLCCNGLMLGAASRTGLEMMAGNFLVAIMLRYVYLPSRSQRFNLGKIFTFAFWCGTIIAIGLLFYFADDMARAIAGGESISNISRYASMTAAIRMFMDTPLWGYGFGQYGFHVVHYMPGWGYYSWEIRAWFTDPMVVWPPVFSLYARLAAETGLIGLVSWIGTWYWMARQIVISTQIHQKMTGQMLLRSYPLVISCFSILFSGIPSDTLHQPMIWLNLGLGCSYLAELRSQRVKRVAEILTATHHRQQLKHAPSSEAPTGAVAT